jgi:hypothetical protein
VAAEIARHRQSTPGSPSICDEHYPHHPGGNGPRQPRPRPRTQAEAEFLAIAAEARRALKAALGGRKAPAVRPGGLRDKVLAHPGKEFTPHEIHKVTGHSSGAIANALETLVKLGEAEVATEKPRRFRRAAQPAEAAPGAASTASADGAQDEGTELAGAA